MYSRTIDFNTEPILSEIDKVIKNGLNELLSEHLNRYELLEKTHQAIMSLPSVLNELNQQPCNSYNSKPQFQEKEKEKEKETDLKSNSIMLFTEDRIKKELDKQYESIMSLFEKMLTKIENLSKEVNELKNTNTKDILGLTVNEVEKENIRLEIEENSESESEDEEDDAEEEVQEEAVDELVEDGLVEEDAVEGDELVEEEEELEDDAVEELVEDELEEDGEELVEDAVEEEDELEEEEDAVEEDAVEEDELEEDAVEEELEDAVEEELVEEVQDEEEESVVEEEQEDEIETENSEEESGGEADKVVEEEEELFEIDIDDVTYCTNNEENGFIYQLLEDNDVGTKVGYLKDGEPFFYADENKL